MSKRQVAIVLRNTDFTEGRGPMTLDKVFSTQKKAEAYVKKQDGIFGSKQYDKPNVYGDVMSWNGYDVVMREVE